MRQKFISTVKGNFPIISLLCLTSLPKVTVLSRSKMAAPVLVITSGRKEEMMRKKGRG